MKAERMIKRIRSSTISLFRKEIWDSPVLRTESTAAVDCESYVEEIAGRFDEHDQDGLTRACRPDASRRNWTAT